MLWICLSIAGFSAGNDSTYLKTLILKELLVQSFGLNKPATDISLPIHLTDKSTISLFPTGELSPVLNSIPGLYLQTGTQQTIKLTIRGIGSRSPYSSNRIRSYLNDIPLTSGDGTSILDDLDLFAIDNIESVKGSQSAWYGSGLGGSIRFNTATKPVKKSESAFMFSAGSFGTYKLAGQTALGFEKGYLRLNIGRNAGDGFRQNSSFYRNNFLLNGQHSKWKYLLSVSEVKAFTPSSIDSLTFADNPSAAAANWLQYKGYKEYKRILSGISYEDKMTEKISHQLTISGSYYDQYELRPFNILDDQAGMFQIKEMIKYKLNDFTFAGGAEYLNETYGWQIIQHNGDMTENSSEKRSQFNAFLQGNIQITSKWHIDLAANLHRNYYLRAKQSAENLIFAPALNLQYKHSSLLQFYLYGGRGFSNPTVEESLSSDGQLNTLLKPETGWSIDAGLKMQSVDNRLHLTFAAYKMWLDDLLVTRRPSEDVFYGENAGKSLLQGLELDLKYQAHNRIKTGVSGSLSQNTFTDFVHNNVDYQGNNLPGIPGIQGNAFLQWTINNHLTGNIFYRYTGRQFADDANLVNIPSWQTIDMQLSSHFLVLKKWNTMLTFCVKNALNASYPSMILINAPSFFNRPPRYYYPALPRNFNFNLQISI